MKRRELFYSLLGVSALPAFLEAQGVSDSSTVVKLTPMEVVANGTVRFFTPAEFQTFRRFGDLMMPEVESEPGASTARAPEFLDFLLSQSPAEIQSLYRSGVRELDRKSMTRYKQPFVKLKDEEAALVVAPLNEPWTWKGPTDSFAQFLQAGKLAFWSATTNSREWAEAQSDRRRGAAGVNAYFLPVE